MKSQSKILISAQVLLLAVSLVSASAFAKIEVKAATTPIATSAIEKTDRKPAAFDPELGPFYTMTFEEMDDLYKEKALDPDEKNHSRVYLYLNTLLIRIQNLPLKVPILRDGPSQGMNKMTNLSIEMKSWDNFRKEIYDLCQDKKNARTCSQMLKDRLDIFDASSADRNPR